MKCNARKKGHGGAEKIPPGEWGGEDYCKREAGWGTNHFGTGRCRSHGGDSPVGIASATFKNGKYSKVIPRGIADSLQEALDDPDLLTLRYEAGLLDVRLKQLLTYLDSGEAGQLWLKLNGMVMYMRELLDDGEEAEGARAQLLQQMMTTIEEGASEYLTWQNIVGMIQQRRGVVESERKRLVDLQQYMTKEQALTLHTALALAVKRKVKDPAVLREVQKEFDAILTAGNGAASAGSPAADIGSAV